MSQDRSSESSDERAALHTGASNQKRKSSTSSGCCQKKTKGDINTSVDNSADASVRIGTITNTDYSVDNHIDNSRSVSNQNENAFTNVQFAIVQNQPVYQIGSQSDTGEAEGEKILAWLYNSDLNFWVVQKNIFTMWERDTGQWLLEEPVFDQWVNGKNHMLFCTGMPGAGKTILMSFAINHLEKLFDSNKTVAITYVYCNYKDQRWQTAANLMRSLLHQLTFAIKGLDPDGQGVAYRAIIQLYNQHKPKETTPSQTEYLETIKIVISSFTRVFIIVDALDEMVKTERDKFLHGIKPLAGFKGITSVLCTSRSIEEITRHFQGDPLLEVTATSKDIETYLTSQIQTKLTAVCLASSDILKDIISKIMNKAQGMFLLARFHLDAVAEATCDNDVHWALQNIPDGLDCTYDNIMERIRRQGPKYLDLAQSVLMWVIYAQRALTISELQHALAIKEGDTELNKGSIVWEKKLLSACAGLVILDPESHTVRLVHYTTQDYLQRHGSQSILPPAPQATIAARCLTYLSFNIFDYFWSDPRQYSLVAYAARNWGDHAREGLLQPEPLVDRIVHFLSQHKMMMDVLIVEKSHLGYREGWHNMELDAAPLILAARFRLYEVVKVLLEKGANVELHGSDGATALHLAAANGHDSMVQLLIEKFATKKEARTNDGATALHIAAANGHSSTVKMLVETFGAEKEARTSDGSTALHIAALFDHVSTIRLLIENLGLDKNAKNLRRRTALAVWCE